jgi:hypothetical protein
MKVSNNKQRPVDDKLSVAAQYTFVEQKLCNVPPHTFSIYGLFYDVSVSISVYTATKLMTTEELERVRKEEQVASSGVPCRHFSRVNVYLILQGMRRTSNV